MPAARVNVSDARINTFIAASLTLVDIGTSGDTIRPSVYIYDVYIICNHRFAISSSQAASFPVVIKVGLFMIFFDEALGSVFTN